MAKLSVYITNLGKYNEGELVGEWVDLPVSEEELDEVYKRIGINDYYEETFITDYESDVPGLTVDEYDSISTLNEMAEKIESLDEYDLKVFKNAMEAGFCDDIDEFDVDNYYLYEGVYDDQTLGETLIDEMYGDLSELPPDVLEDNFDIEAFGRDCRIEWYAPDWLDGYDEEEIKERFGVDDVDEVSIYDYCGVADGDDYGVGEYMIDNIYGSISELGKSTLETYFDYSDYAADISRFEGAYTEDGWLWDRR